MDEDEGIVCGASNGGHCCSAHSKQKRDNNGVASALPPKGEAIFIGRLGGDQGDPTVRKAHQAETLLRRGVSQSLSAFVKIFENESVNFARVCKTRLSADAAHDGWGLLPAVDDAGGIRKGHESGV